MDEQKSCQDCSTKNSCQDVYCEIGKKKGQSIVIKAVTALLLPMLVFITTLVATEKILKTQLNIENKEMQTIIVFLTAIAVTAIAVIIIKVINKKTNNE